MKILSFLFLTFCFEVLARTDLKSVIKTPKEFSVEIYAEVDGARQMAISPKGILYVGSMDAGKVYAVGIDKKVTVVAQSLTSPQGVVWHNGSLYIAEIHQVSRIDKIDENFAKNPKMVVVKTFPSDRHHGWKTINIGPDGKMYVPIGAPCNVCDKPLPYMTIHRMNLDGSGLETVAQGIRNTVGFTWHPETKQLWFTDMGRDMMGDDVPPEEINVITKMGEHFGFPYLHAGKIKDPQFGDKVPKGLIMTPPVQTMQAHAAPIGIAFFPKDKYPKEFHNCFMVAHHGSWNRSKKSGYEIAKGCVVNGKVTNYAPYITGFKEGESVFARPVHFLFLNDGSFLVSEDSPGTILKFSLKK
jgi:glucose/arabinose dehydrogenase